MQLGTWNKFLLVIWSSNPFGTPLQPNRVKAMKADIVVTGNYNKISIDADNSVDICAIAVLAKAVVDS